MKDQGGIDALSKEIGAVTVLMDTEYEHGKDFPLEPQGTVTIKYKVTHLTGVMP